MINLYTSKGSSYKYSKPVVMPMLKQTNSIMVNESDMSFQEVISPKIAQKHDSYNHCKDISKTSSLEDKYGIPKF